MRGAVSRWRRRRVSKTLARELRQAAKDRVALRAGHCGPSSAQQLDTVDMNADRSPVLEPALIGHIDELAERPRCLFDTAPGKCNGAVYDLRAEQVDFLGVVRGMPCCQSSEASVQRDEDVVEVLKAEGTQ